MLNSKEKLQQALTSLQKECVNDQEATRLINDALSELKHNIDVDKVILGLNQNINNYSLTYNFQLPAALTKLQIMLRENPDKWRNAGLTGSI